MSVHLTNPNSLPDSSFETGDIKYIVRQNVCRMLDGRRTPGIIENYFEDVAMFRWRITDFEDKGNYWDVPAEDIELYQILKGSKELSDTEIDKIHSKIEEFSQTLIINIDEMVRKETDVKIASLTDSIIAWLKGNSEFFRSNTKLELDSSIGNKMLSDDLKKYLKELDMLDIEEKTAKDIVMNPISEWIKGISIVLAKMSIVKYQNKILRGDIFIEVGGEDKVKEYLFHRIAFLRAYFYLLNITEVHIYRGMCTEGEMVNYDKSLTSWTFSPQVALSFCDFEDDKKYKNGYILMRTIPIENFFMTFIETDEMNCQYKESEAILFYNKELYLW